MKRLRLRAVAVWLSGKVATILIKFSHILTIYTQVERKNRYTLKKAKLFTLKKNLNCYTKLFMPEPELEPKLAAGDGQDWTGSTTLVVAVARRKNGANSHHIRTILEPNFS